MATVLDIAHLRVSYGNKIIVNDVSFSVEEGEILAIIGESGSGKSTIIRSILNLLPPTAQVQGDICFKGNTLTTLKEAEINPLRGRELAVIFQNPSAYFNPLRSIENHYNDFLKAHGVPIESTLKIDMLRSVGFSEPERILKSYIQDLSGGMQQRVSIAMAMTLKPSLLLADEPTSALDAIYQEEILLLIKSLCRQYNTALVLVTHNLHAATAMADYIAIMQAGNLVEWGTGKTIQEYPQTAYTKYLWDAL